MHRKFAIASAIAVVVAAAFLPGAGLSSSAAPVHGAQLALPDGLADAIHARFGAAPIRVGVNPADKPEMGLRTSVSADGTTALVAAPGLGGYTGAVYVYHAASAGAWTSTSTPTATLKGPGSHGLFGQRVLLSADGTTAFIGAPYAKSGAGAAYVYHVASESSWASTSTPTATLTAGGSDIFGGAMAVSDDGTTIVVGAPSLNNDLGGAYIFHASAEDAWVTSSTPTAVLTNAAEPSDDEAVGASVAISGDGTTVLLSDMAVGDYTGGAYVFHVASGADWATSSVPNAILSNASGASGDYLGQSLAISGDGTTAFIAAFGAKHETGAVDVFHVAAANSWATSSTPTAILTRAAGGRGDALGGVVRASTDGLTVVASAVGAAKGAGTVDVFHVADEGSWATTSAPKALLTESARQANDGLGWGVAISADGTTVVAGAPGVNWSTGDAHVFHVADKSSWVTSSHPAATLKNSALPKPMCVVPRLKGAPLAILKYVLPYYDCRLGKVKRVHVTVKRERKHVIRQSPAPGSHRHAGWRIKVVVGK